MLTTLRLLATSAGFALALGCVRSAPAENRASDPPPTAPASTPSASQEVSVLDSRTRGWVSGKAYAYRLKMTSSVAFGDGANTFDFDVSGNLDAVPATVTSDVVTLYLTLGDVRVDSRIPNTKAEFDKIGGQLVRQGCFVALSGGRVTYMRFPKGMPAMPANVFRAIASSLQVARPAREEARYTALEYDTTGQYQAEYQVEGASHVVRKRKGRYLSLLAASTTSADLPANLVPEVLRSEGEIRLSDDGRPTAVIFHDELRVKGAQAPISSKNSVTLEPADPAVVERQARDWTELLDATEPLAASAPYGTEASVEALDDARINGMTFDKVVRRLEEIGKQRKGAAGEVNAENAVQEESKLFVALSAMFRRRPETIAQAVAKATAKSPAAPTLIAALGSSSSPLAQQALVKLMKSKGVDPELQRQATLALTRSSRPGDQAIEALREMLVADPFSEKALFGLGTYCRRLRDEGKTEQADEIGRLLVDRLEQATTTSPLLTVLRALTNAGYAAALPKITPYLADEREQVRALAVRSLQSMRDPNVDRILASRLEKDPSTAVRLSAIEAIEIRGPKETLSSGLVKAATTASDPHIRYRAVELMAHWLNRRPDLRPTLEHVAQGDEEERIRERAKAAL